MDEAEPLLFIDMFHEVRQMIKAFNNHYESEYSPAWLSCLNKSMNSWLNKFCPGFMLIPKSHGHLGMSIIPLQTAMRMGTIPSCGTFDWSRGRIGRGEWSVGVSLEVGE